MMDLPHHLRKYIVQQDYEKYTELDHAVWRYILRQLRYFLTENAHESYLDGLKKTGIEIERIPRIEDISRHLEKFGWRALPVSGFIPPAAFMELQSLSILPIASDMRSIDHLLYTPAPDIVHEAAGHAPIIANPEYSGYLRQYAQVAKKAIISREDLNVYKAIRELSDIKENPASSQSDILAAEQNLAAVAKSVKTVSEAAELSRMNWWTAEYGLIGPLESPKIFGAGLLSSVGESKWCLSDKVKRIPLSLDCIYQAYDITEPQPQLYVARDFQHLTEVLEELSLTMAYRIGGVKALERARQAESINTVEFENGLQISGVLKNYFMDSHSQPCYLQFSGPSQLSYESHELSGQGPDYHAQGYGTPVGEISDFNLKNLKLNELVELNYTSGVKVSGKLIKTFQAATEAVVLTLENATCEFKNEKLFLPEWGNYDIVIAKQVKPVWGAPADRDAFGEIDDFVASRVVPPAYSEEQKTGFSFYGQVRQLRQQTQPSPQQVKDLYEKFRTQAPKEWLLFLELIEMAIKNQLDPALIAEIENHLLTFDQNPLVTDGLKLAHAKY